MNQCHFIISNKRTVMKRTMAKSCNFKNQNKLFKRRYKKCHKYSGTKYLC